MIFLAPYYLFVSWLLWVVAKMQYVPRPQNTTIPLELKK